MITYDKGLPSLPDDIICEIFGFLDMEALKSCSLTGKALSFSAKPFIHRTLYLTFEILVPDVSRRRNKPSGLPILGERGLLQHIRHLSIAHRNSQLYAYDLQPHTQHLRTLTSLRSLKTHRLDIPSIIPKVEEYFGAFFGSLQSLELELPRGDSDQILYLVSQFPNLRDLKIFNHYVECSVGSCLDIKPSPPLDGTIDIKFGMDIRQEGGLIGAKLFLRNLATLPPGPKPRTLKLSWCIGNDLQFLVDACAPTLECLEFSGKRFSASFLPRGTPLTHAILPSGASKCPPLSFKRHPALRKLEIVLPEHTKTEGVVDWLSETLSTITSNVFTKLTISVALDPFLSPTANEFQVREWSLVDKVLDRFSLCDVTLVVRRDNVGVGDMFRVFAKRYFPLMWENGEVVPEVESPIMKNGLPRWIEGA